MDLFIIKLGVNQIFRIQITFLKTYSIDNNFRRTLITVLLVLTVSLNHICKCIIIIIKHKKMCNLIIFHKFH